MDNNAVVSITKLTQGLSPGLLAYLQSFKQTRGALLDLENKRPGIIDRLLNFEPNKEDLVEINQVVERFAPVLENNVEKLSKDRDDQVVLQALEHVSEEPIHTESIQTKRRDFVEKLTKNWEAQLRKQYGAEVAEQVSSSIETKLQTSTTRQTSSSLQFEAQKIANQELRVAKLPVFTQEIDNQVTSQEAIELDTVLTTRNTRSVIAERMIQDIPVYDPVLFALAVNEVALYSPNKTETPRRLIAEAEALARTATAFESDYGSTNAPRILWSRPELRAVSSENKQLSVINTVVRQGFVDLINNEGLVSQLGITSVPLLQALQQTFQKSTTTESSPGFNSAVTSLTKFTNEVVGSVSGARESQDGYGAFLLVRGTDLLRGRQLQNKPFKNFQFDISTGKDELLLKFLTLTATDQQLIGLKEQITNNNKLREWMTTKKDSSPFLAALLENPKQGLNEFRETTSTRMWITMYFSQLYGVQGESRFTKMTGLQLYRSAFRIARGNINAADQAALAFQAFGGSVGKGLLSKVLILGKMTGGPVGIALMAFGGIKNFIGGVGNFFTNMFGGQSSKKKGTPVWMWVLGVLIGLMVFLLTGDVQTIQRSELAEQASEVGVTPANTNSRFINVEKSVSQSSFPQNNAGVVTYTVSISATEKALTDITVNDVFSVFTENTASAPQPNAAVTKTSLQPGENQTVTYQVDLSAFRDALISNTVTVRAVVDGKEETSKDTVSVTIGQPPTSCFVFNDEVITYTDGPTFTTTAWKEEEKNQVLGAISSLAGYSTYLSRLCGGGAINLYRSSGTTSYGGVKISDNSFVFYQLGVDYPNYTLIHESGHIFQSRNPSIYMAFQDSVSIASARDVPCTYTATWSLEAVSDWIREAFAESIALYITNGDQAADRECLGGSFQTKYPQHWSFVDSNVFN